MDTGRRAWSMVAVGVAAVAAGLALGGCCDSTGPDDADRDFPYPLDIGNRWEYRREIWISDPMPPFRRGAALMDTTFESACVVEVVRSDSLSSSVADARVLHETLTEGTSSYERDLWYANESDGLYFCAYQPGVSAAAPKPMPGVRFVVGGRHFDSVWRVAEFLELGRLAGARDPDSLIIEDPPLRAFPYPPQQGYEWMYREPGSPWHINKRITGTAHLAVPGGEFDCHEVRWLVDFHDDGQWDDDIVLFDYIAPEGLVRRSLYTWLWIVTEGGDTLGLYQMREQTDLTRVELCEP